MFKPHTVLVIGLWLVALDFLGIPAVWKTRLYLLTGILIVLVYLKYFGREAIVRFAQEHSTSDTFTQNGHADTPATPPTQTRT